jgi:hypothetical protein
LILQIITILAYQIREMVTDNEIFELFINPHQVAVRKMHEEALSEMNDGGLTISIGRTYNRLKAVYLNNVILEKAKPYFRGVEGITIDEKYDSLVFNYDSGILGRFRKSSKVVYPKSLAETQRNKAIIQGTLFTEYSPMVSLEIRYVVNSTWSEYEKISVIKLIDKVAIEIHEIPTIEIYQPETIKAEESVIKLPQKEKQITIKNPSK